ncbi:MAG TPA: hypothetical protein VIQ51_17775 [Chryseosolibacter sp.]
MKALYPVVLLLVSSLAQAQKHTISGTIKDKASGEYLIGASIYNIHSLQGTTANNYGFYSMTLSKKHHHRPAMERNPQQQTLQQRHSNV